MVRRLARDRAGLLGAVIVGTVVLAAAFGPALAQIDPTAIHPGARLRPPGYPYFLGTDELGRDLLSRTLSGARISLTVGLAAVMGAALLGIPIGIMAGYYKGRVDALFMRIMDVLYAFPPILLALGLVAVLGPDLRNLIIAVSVVYIPAFARIARAGALVATAEAYFEAARSVGASDARIMLRHVLPNAAPPIFVQFTVNLAFAIVVEASLSFLGLGVQPPTPSWGSMLSQGKFFLQQSIWPSLVPGVVVMLTVLAFNLLGDGLRDILDPRLRDAGS